jgi:hypothetical protein
MGLSRIFVDPAREMLIKIGSFLATLLGIIVILVIGWLIAKLIKNLVIKVLKVIQLDNVADQAGISKFFAKGGISYSLSELIGILCYWLAMLIVVVVAVNAVGLNVAAELLNRVVLYIPNVIVSIFILVLGMFLANFFAIVIKTAASNAGIEQAQLLAKIVEVVVIVFAIAIALEQLRIGADIVRLAIAIILASLGLGFAIALGLGCKDIVGEAVGKTLDKLKSKK